MNRLSDDVEDGIQRGGTLVVPSRQRAQAIRLAHAAAELKKGRSVWRTADVLTADGWLSREIERTAAAGVPVPRLLSPAEEWFLWRQCTAELTSDLDLVARGALADALRRARQLALEFGIEVQANPTADGSEHALLRRVCAAVEERARTMRATTALGFASREPAVGSDKPLLFAGFSHLPRSLMLAAQERGRKGLETSIRQHAQGAGSARIVLASDPVDELERIADWCRHRLEQHRNARLLVVLPGARSARERLHTLIHQTLDPAAVLRADVQADSSSSLVELEGGDPLAEAPLVEHALKTLSWLVGGSEFDELSAWLRAPWWLTPDPAARAKLDLWLREHRLTELGVRELLKALGAAPPTLASPARDLAQRINAALRCLGTGEATPREWSERFLAALTSFGWPGKEGRSSDEQQTVVRFTELLDELGELAASARTFSREEAVQLLSDWGSRVAFRPAGGDPLVTISPQPADPVVIYDGLWVAGLHAEAWPPAVQPDPFLPLGAQLAAGIPAASAVGRLAEARQIMTAWRCAAGELVYSAPSTSGDLELLPSPLLAEWAREEEWPRPAGSVWLPARMRRDNVLEVFDDANGVPWSSDLTLPGGTRALELQNLCPFRAYAELRLGSAEVDAPEPGVAADTRGRLLHAALELLWGHLRDSNALHSLSEPAEEALVAECVTRAADTVLDTTADGLSAAHQRECRRTARLIRRLCALERERSPFRVREREWATDLVLAAGRMRVRIDRLDTLEDGALAILDYKSGRRTAADWYGERPSHAQLLAYLAAVGEGVAAMATVNVTAREVRFEGISALAGVLPQVKQVRPLGQEDTSQAWAHRRNEWLACIERLAANFVTGRAEVDPMPRACDYCHAISICRIAERGSVPNGQGDAENGDE